MRRTILLLATMALTLLIAVGVALAVNKIGTQGRDFLRGTDAADHLVGKGENDRIFSLAGNDTLIGGPGKDLLWAVVYVRCTVTSQYTTRPPGARSTW